MATLVTHRGVMGASWGKEGTVSYMATHTMYMPDKDPPLYRATYPISGVEIEHRITLWGGVVVLREKSWFRRGWFRRGWEVRKEPSDLGKAKIQGCFWRLWVVILANLMLFMRGFQGEVMGFTMLYAF